MATHSLLPVERHDVYDFISPYAELKDAAKGKTILITGAGTGIGRATAHTFAAAGASHLILAARRASPLFETKSHILSSYPNCQVHLVPDTDISSPSSVAALFSHLSTLCPTQPPTPLIPDLLINNAATSHPSPIAAGDDADAIADWWGDFEVNVRGTYLVTRGYLRMLEREGTGKRGRVICTSSNGSWREIEGMSGYAMSKAGVNRFVEYVDREHRGEDGGGIRAFALHPGGVAGTGLGGGGEVPEWLAPLMVDKPELAAGVALYLSTPRADFLGGRYVSGTWDMEKLEGMKEKILEEDLLKTRILGIAP